MTIACNTPGIFINHSMGAAVAQKVERFVYQWKGL